MDANARQIVQRRAGDRCEYCRMPQPATPLITFHVEHIIPRQHGGSDDTGNLALACDRCNAFKGPNLSTMDSATGNAIRVFNPRRDRWDEHFRLEEGVVMGLTPMGQATVRLLRMNASGRVNLRCENTDEAQ